MLSKKICKQCKFFEELVDIDCEEWGCIVDLTRPRGVATYTSSDFCPYQLEHILEMQKNA